MYNASSYTISTPKSIAASTIKPIAVKSKVIVLNNNNNIDTIDEDDNNSIGNNSINQNSIV